MCTCFVCYLKLKPLRRFSFTSSGVVWFSLHKFSAINRKFSVSPFWNNCIARFAIGLLFTCGLFIAWFNKNCIVFPIIRSPSWCCCVFLHSACYLLRLVSLTVHQTFQEYPLQRPILPLFPFLPHQMYHS